MKVIATNRRWFETADGTRYRGGTSREGAAQPFDLSDDNIRRYTRMGVQFEAVDDDSADRLETLTTIDPASAWPSVFTAEQRANLEAAGYTTPAAVRAATDEQLTAVASIGEATVKRFRQTEDADVVIR